VLANQTPAFWLITMHVACSLQAWPRRWLWDERSKSCLLICDILRAVFNISPVTVRG